MSIVLQSFSYRFLSGLFISLLIQIPLSAAPVLSPRIANYEIFVDLDPLKKTLDAHETLTWRNASDMVVKELQMHLYMNAFKNTASTFMQEGRRSRIKKRKDNEWGFIEIDTLIVLPDADLTGKIEYIAPDDQNKRDETVVRIPLPFSVRPGQTITIDIDFSVKLPKIIARTGFVGDFFLVAQWYPKIGVLESDGWNCHQFHRNSEFFADFGVYHVQITVPQTYTVGAVGQQLSEEMNSDGSKTLFFDAVDVHDFAWTASPEYLVAEDNFQETQIKFYHMPWHDHLVHRHIEPLKQSLQLVTEWFGEYPYRTISFVTPPLKAMNAGGMEYPTFFTAGAVAFFPDNLRFTELVTIHEFCHNYWYGMVASNEFEEPWLDEGINSYTDTKVLEHIYGQQGNLIDLLGIRLGERDVHRLSYLGKPATDPIVKPAWKFFPGQYSTISYSKSVLMLLTLENLIGAEKMQQLLHTYFQRWKFKHPRTQDFIDVANEVSGQNLDYFFRMILFGTDVVDYAVASLRYQTIKPYLGIGYGPKEEASEDDTDSIQTAESDSMLYHSRVYLERKGEIQLPVDYVIKFADGGEIRDTWDGKERWYLLEFKKTTYVTSAEVDPDRKIPLDINYFNNSRTADFQSAGVNRIWLKFLFWIQNMLWLITVSA